MHKVPYKFVVSRTMRLQKIAVTVPAENCRYAACRKLPLRRRQEITVPVHVTKFERMIQAVDQDGGFLPGHCTE